METSGEVEIAGILRKLIQMSMYNVPPDGYYERAKEEFGSKAPLVHDIDSLYKILMSVKLPKTKWVLTALNLQQFWNGFSKATVLRHI